MRRLLLVLGDQLDSRSALLRDADPSRDIVWMAEVRDESTHVWSHRARTTLFLSAMRHFRDELREQGFEVEYRSIGDEDGSRSLADALRATIERRTPDSLRVVEPGDHRVLTSLQTVAQQHDLPLEILPDDHFLCSTEEFREYARGRKQLRLEYFYRDLRRRYSVLMDGAEPLGGQWNYDKENREPFGRGGPGRIPPPPAFSPDTITRGAIADVEAHFPGHPGRLDGFDWPVTREQALVALEDFLEHRLRDFGRHQDAMWTDEPFLYHSLISSSLNLKLLRPLEVIEATEAAHRDGRVPLAAAEGFIRQILGWREYVRGVYWNFMPEYGERNALGAKEPLPSFYWTGDTEFRCLAQSIGQTLDYGYAHHIQRLMVTGLFSLLLGVDPRRIHEWYLAVYVDAVEWVELPNVIGMSQYADGGTMASKPYVATGKYIQRMSNYCTGCRFDPAKSTGEDACPFTTLYWEFLDRHRDLLSGNTRMGLQLKNLDRLDDPTLEQIRIRAREVRSMCRSAPGPE